MAETNNITAAGKPFVISRTFNAPRNLVWKAWTETEHLSHWWGPKGCTVEIKKLDLRPGGLFHYRLMFNGQEIWGRFVFREITAPERLLYVNSFSDPNGEIAYSPFHGAWPRELLTTVTFVEKSGGTEVTVSWQPVEATAEERKAFDDNHASMQGGWGGSFDVLAEYLAKKQA